MGKAGDPAGHVRLIRAAEKIVRTDLIIVTGTAHKVQPRLPCAVFVMAQKGLTYVQLRRRLTLAYVPFAAQGRECLRKGPVHTVFASFDYFWYYIFAVNSSQEPETQYYAINMLSHLENKRKK